ncbi:MAG: L-2-hydroxyglutarate oxidase [Anaerolineaceae bacterium]|jgi:L-2-hydroxyglutarate oxidase|nr:L-2-hydroxyglutarate oxidase [Anaerolineaceae bacterium]
MKSSTYDVAIIGAGIVGLATALKLVQNYRLSLIILEAENQVAAHQTGHNSGVIHSGLYYKPGSLKALNCVAGREAMYRFCEENGIAHERCGKVVVATNPLEIPALNMLEERGIANGLDGIRRLTPEEIREIEPHVNGIDGLWVPQTGIVDYKDVSKTYAHLIEEAGGEIKTNSRVIGFSKDHNIIKLQTTSGEIEAKNLINCAGLRSDQIARLCGVEPGLQIIPFRGEYYEVIPEKEHLVKNLIYPVPDVRFPFLGVHFTRMVHGGVEAGPNAVLALKREGYKKSDISIPDMAFYGTYIGFWRMALKYWKMSISETYRSFNKRAFVRALQRLIPELQMQDVHPAGSGVRAQALSANGKLLDDFSIVEKPNQVHVLNAPSPAATASLSIGETIATMAEHNFQLVKIDE